MYKIIISRLRRGTRRSSGNTCSIKKLLCMESRKDLYDKNASEKGVDMVSLDRDTMIRISKNPGWYQALYKSYGCAPNARELYDIAHKKMKNEVYYNLGKNDAEGMSEKETMEAAKRRVESLERVKDIVDKFDDGDIVAQSLLEPETYEQVYKPTVETLSQGNAAVKKSARDSALILSKMAENFHKNYGVPLKMATVKITKETKKNGYTQEQYSWADSEKCLKIDESEFSKSLDEFRKGNIKKPMVRVMMTPLVLKLVGAKLLPIEIATRDLSKILYGKHAGDMDSSVMKQLPRALADPVMIFSSYTGRDGELRKVVVVSMKDNNGTTIVTPLELEANNIPGRYKINRITSVFGKTDKKTENHQINGLSSS